MLAGDCQRTPHQTGNQENEKRKELQVCGKDRPPSGLLFVPPCEASLDNVLISRMWLPVARNMYPCTKRTTHEGELKTSCIRFRMAVYRRMSNGGDHLITRCAADAADRVGCSCVVRPVCSEDFGRLRQPLEKIGKLRQPHEKIGKLRQPLEKN
jgi:hypothetical protein